MLQLLDADSGELLQEKRISGRFLVTFLLPPKGGVYQVAVQCEGGLLHKTFAKRPGSRSSYEKPLDLGILGRTESSSRL